MNQPTPETSPAGEFNSPIDATVDSIRSHVDAAIATARHPLGWPKGSVRAVLALCTAACVYILLGMGNPVGENLLSTLFIILGYYFAVRVGEGPSDDKPLGLPKGSVRTLLVVGFAVGTGFWLVHTIGVWTDVGTSFKTIITDPLWPVVANLGAFLGGRLVRLIVEKFKSDAQSGLSRLVGDVKAIVCLLAAAGVIIAFLTPLTESLDVGVRRHSIEGLLAVVTFYFGTR